MLHPRCSQRGAGSDCLLQLSMKKNAFLWQTAKEKRGLPILSFPAAQKLGVTVKELILSADLQAQAMAYIANQTPTAAAVSLMDLSVEAEAFGASVRFLPDEVPSVQGQLVDGEAAADALEVPSLDRGRAMLCVDAVGKAKKLVAQKPVFAGVIGPFSLAGRLMDVTEILYACYDEPDAVMTVVRKAAQYLMDYCRAFKAAGADGIVMAEPLAGILSPDMAETFSCQAVKGMIDALQTPNFPIIYHNCGNTVPNMLPQLYAMGAAAYHFGNAVDMAQVLSKTPGDVLVMGNIDPAGQFASGTPEGMRAAVKALMAKCSQYPNFLPSSGCDIPAHAPWANIDAFFEALQ